MKRMAANLKIVDFFKHGLDLLKSRITEFNHLAAFVTDDVVMLAICLRALINRLISSKLMALHQPTLQQQVKSIIDRSP